MVSKKLKESANEIIAKFSEEIMVSCKGISVREFWVDTEISWTTYSTPGKFISFDSLPESLVENVVVELNGDLNQEFSGYMVPDSVIATALAIRRE